MFLHRTLAGQAFDIDESTNLGAFAVRIIDEIAGRNVVDLRVASLAGGLTRLRHQVVRLRSALYFRYEGTGPGERCVFHYKVPVDEGTKLLIKGVFSPNRFEASSPRDFLSGQRNVYIVGIVTDVNEAVPEVTVRPMLIGRPYFVPANTEMGMRTERDRPEVYSSHVDEFDLSSGNLDVPASKAELSTLFGMSEMQVKKAFASILGISMSVLDDTSYLPKDWGGEKSDLVANITITGVPGRAAFAFKGPAGKTTPWRLYPGRMGKGATKLYVSSQKSQMLWWSSTAGTLISRSVT